MLKDKQIVLGVTGGIAAFKACSLVSQLRKWGVRVNVIMTKNATAFVAPLSFESLSKYKISEREFTVVQLICEGLTNKEIAQELSISVNTVNNHVANIFSKLEITNRKELGEYVIK